MASIILDCNLMRNRNSGLYHYCLNVGLNVNYQLEQAERDIMKMYVPHEEQNSFTKHSHTIVEKMWHKVWAPFLNNCRVWHAPFQMGRILPDKKIHPNIKVLLTIHDLNALYEGKPLLNQRKSMDHTQALIDRSDAIVCISEFTKLDVLKHCEVGNRPVYAIHNGIHRVNAPTQFLSTGKIKKPFLFGIGYVNAKKNFHVLLPLLKYNPGIEMVIAGKFDDPDYVEDMKKKAETLGVSDRLHLTGTVSENDKAWYLSNCLAFVHPSLAEGFGAPVVEAMLFGKPLFLSDRTSLPEIGGDAAFYFTSFDEERMQAVFTEGMQRYNDTGMSEMIINHGKKFDWEKSAVKYLDVYNSLL
jgi:glycosyltransferase involved in cell wall biosynthesis